MNLPPCSIGAEEQVIGSALLGVQGVERLVTELVPEDFYKPFHADVVRSIITLYAGGFRIDPAAVKLELIASGATKRVPEPDSLLMAMMSAASSYDPRRFAAEVVDCATRRRAMAVLGEAREALNDRTTDLAEVSERARMAVGSIEMPILATKPDPDLAAFLATEDEYDWLVHGLLEVGDRCLLTAGEGAGKMLRVDEPVPTPSGWSTMGELVTGDVVFDRHGSPCTVTHAFPVEDHPNAYAVRFSDGTTIEADAHHQWWTVDYYARQSTHEPKVRNTAEIMATLNARNGHVVNHAVPVAGPLDCPSQVLPIPPYTLGVWLGDGTTADGSVTLNRLDADEIEARMDSEGQAVRRRPGGERPGSVLCGLPKLRVTLRQEGLLGDKRIPPSYLRASIDQRWALLQGIMDTDGYVEDARGAGRGKGAASCELTLTCPGLAADALELIRSLGIKVTCSESDATLYGRVVSRRWRMAFQCERNPFSIKRKGDRWFPLRTRRARYRYIVAVDPVRPSPMRCISVDSPDHSYLVGREMIPTHNSLMLRQIAVCLAAGVHPFTLSPVEPLRVMILDLENSVAQTRRWLRRIHLALVGMGHTIADGMLRPVVRSEGIDLLERADVRWLYERFEANRPQIVIGGPLYKTHAGNPNDEGPAAAAAKVWDVARQRYGFAMLIEAHAGHGQSGIARELRPYGASLWRRWPEFGLGLSVDRDDENTYHLKTWRGSRDERAWPSRLRRGGVLPWTVERSRAIPNEPPPELLDGPTERPRYAN